MKKLLKLLIIVMVLMAIVVVNNEQVTIKTLEKNKYLAEEKIPEIEYELNKNGKWIFENNPEFLIKEDMADINNKALVIEKINGNTVLSFEHAVNNFETSDGFFYGINLKNESTKDVNVSINKIGISNYESNLSNLSENWKDTLNSYYNEDRDMSLTISAQRDKTFYIGKVEGKYSLVDKENASRVQQFDGMINLQTSGNLMLTTYACLNVDNVEIDNLTYNGMITQDREYTYNGKTYKENLKRVYTGIYNGLPEVTNNITFATDDLSVGRLKVSYRTSNNAQLDDSKWEKYIGNSWTTNNAKPVYNNSFNYVRKETLPLTVQFDAKENVMKYNTANDPSNWIYNFENWYVEYNENITLKNEGTKERRYSFFINAHEGDTGYKTIFSGTKQCDAKFVYKKDNYAKLYGDTKNITKNNSIEKIWTVELKPGEQVTVPTIVTLGGMSYGSIEKWMQIEDYSTITYNKTLLTNSNVIAKIATDYKILNNNGNNQYEFKENGTFKFKLKDKNGNIVYEIAKVDWIDKDEPNIEKIGYWFNTNNDQVIVSITANEPIYISGWTPANDNKNKITKTVSKNKLYEEKVSDAAGNIKNIKFTTNTKNVKSILINKEPKKIEFVQNEDNLSTVDGELKVIYDDDSSEIISLTNEMISNFDNSILGKQTLIVTYKGKSVQYNVTVIEKNKEDDGKKDEKTNDDKEQNEIKNEIKNETNDNNTKKDNKNEQNQDNTLANSQIPRTGIIITAYVLPALIVLLTIVGIIERIKYKKFKDIK